VSSSITKKIRRFQKDFDFPLDTTQFLVYPNIQCSVLWKGDVDRLEVAVQKSN